MSDDDIISSVSLLMARKWVPAALHSELTEYASLLRALRTSDTLDVTTQLTRHQEKTRAIEDTDDEEDYEDNDEDVGTKRPGPSVSFVGMDVDDDGPVTGPSNYEDVPDHSQRKRKRQPSTTSASLSRPTSPEVAPNQPGARRRRRRKDTWTLWPLLLEDVPVPEWTLQDEVAIIAKQLLKQQRPLSSNTRSPSRSSSPPNPSPPVSPTSSLQRPPPTSSPPHSAPSSPSSPVSQSHSLYLEDADVHSDSDSDYETEDDEDEELSSYLPALTHSTELYLHHILSSIAAIIPPRPASMQNRIRTINWETVLDALVACAPMENGTSENEDKDSVMATNGVSAKTLNRVRERMQAIYGPSNSRGRTQTQAQGESLHQTSPVRVISSPHKQGQAQDAFDPLSTSHPHFDDALSVSFPTSVLAPPMPTFLANAPAAISVSETDSDSALAAPPIFPDAIASTSLDQDHSHSQSQPQSLNQPPAATPNYPPAPSSVYPDSHSESHPALTTHRLAAFLSSKNRLLKALDRYGATEDTLLSDSLAFLEAERNGDLISIVDDKTKNAVLRRRSKLNKKEREREKGRKKKGERTERDATTRDEEGTSGSVSARRDQAEGEADENDEDNGDVNGENISARSRPRRKAKSLSQRSTILGATEPKEMKSLSAKPKPRKKKNSEVSAGTSKKGTRKGNPRKATRVQPSSRIAETTRTMFLNSSDVEEGEDSAAAKERIDGAEGTNRVFHADFFGVF
ncbi:hypothetical protein D9758_009375 [Tetrapyrgos nigripes]|uniref:Uncharacterized protein n=1 Tax=Tetrapyrgos nigripes TaxID=182062 RepID=A0A8H5D1V0_9AGAR|nr:hypothetical protein D9758_009375 [Tetrapyrgos nigripes]